MNKLQTLMKETVCQAVPQGMFAFALAPMRNEENVKDLRLVVQGSCQVKKGRAKLVEQCEPIDLQMTINNMAGKLLALAKANNFEVEQEEADEAKARAEREKTAEAEAAAAKEQAEADAAKAEAQAAEVDERIPHGCRLPVERLDTLFDEAQSQAESESHAEAAAAEAEAVAAEAEAQAEAEHIAE